jgi:hypothetical protein
MNQPTLKEFLRVLYTDWTSGVSGSLSVPFTILALYVRNASAKTLFGLLAVLALLVAVYRVWEKERLQLLVEFQKNSDAERQRREVEMQTAREELVKLQRENQQAADARRLEQLDEEVLKLVKEVYADLEAHGSRPGAMFFPREWIEKAAKELKVGESNVQESLNRLKQAGKLNAVRW